MPRIQQRRPKPSIIIDWLLTIALVICLVNVWSSPNVQETEQPQQQERQQRATSQQRQQNDYLLQDDRDGQGHSFTDQASQFILLMPASGHSTSKMADQPVYLLASPIDTDIKHSNGIRTSVKVINDNQFPLAISTANTIPSLQHDPNPKIDNEMLVQQHMQQLSPASRYHLETSQHISSFENPASHSVPPQAERKTNLSAPHQAVQPMLSSSKHVLKHHIPIVPSRRLKRTKEVIGDPVKKSTFKSGTRRFMTRFLGWACLLSLSVIAGGLLAKRAIDRATKWEQQAQEDSLAYDIAYTTSTSEVGYGSFVSSWSGNDFDRFDV